MNTPRSSNASEEDLSEQNFPELPVLLVLGLTGAGKSTFINHVARTTLPVGKDMTACTTATAPVKASIGDVEFLLVDTPGFDDPEKSDAGVLYDVTEWIKHNLGADRKVTGALYLHSIQTEKMYGSSMRNFLLFSKLVGSTSMSNVGLVTTRWDVVDRAVALHREAQLSAKPWEYMLKKGARRYRTRNDYESCYAVVRTLLEVQPSFLKIQIEMGSEKKHLSRTEAGEHVCHELLARIETEKMYVKELQKSLKDPSIDEFDRKEFAKQLNEATEKLQTYEADLDMIKKVPSWGEWTLGHAKTHGATIAGSIIMHAVSGRSNALAMNAMQSQVAAIVAENVALKAAAAKAVGGGALLGSKLVQGMGAGSSYYFLEKTVPVIKQGVIWAAKSFLGA